MWKGHILRWGRTVKCMNNGGSYRKGRPRKEQRVPRQAPVVDSTAPNSCKSLRGISCVSNSIWDWDGESKAEKKWLERNCMTRKDAPSVLRKPALRYIFMSNETWRPSATCWVKGNRGQRRYLAMKGHGRICTCLGACLARLRQRARDFWLKKHLHGRRREPFGGESHPSGTKMQLKRPRSIVGPTEKTKK